MASILVVAEVVLLIRGKVVLLITDKVLLLIRSKLVLLIRCKLIARENEANSLAILVYAALADNVEGPHVV